MTSNTRSILISILIIGSAIAWTQFRADTGTQTPIAAAVSVRDDGTQHITILAKSGYHPNDITAKADFPTDITFITSNSFECANDVYIPAINFKQTLPRTGTTTIPLGTYRSGEVITGGCSTSVSEFTIRFE